MNINDQVSFHNPLKEDFTFRWDKAPFTVKGGETGQFSFFLARHGAKHLVDYIILNPDVWGEVGIERSEGNRNTSVGREEILDKILNTTEVKEEKKVEKKKEVKEKKVEKKKEEPKEEEFADLKDK